MSSTGLAAGCPLGVRVFGIRKKRSLWPSSGSVRIKVEGQRPAFGAKGGCAPLLGFRLQS